MSTSSLAHSCVYLLVALVGHILGVCCSACLWGGTVEHLASWSTALSIWPLGSYLALASGLLWCVPPLPCILAACIPTLSIPRLSAVLWVELRLGDLPSVHVSMSVDGEPVQVTFQVAMVGRLHGCRLPDFLGDILTVNFLSLCLVDSSLGPFPTDP